MKRGDALRRWSVVHAVINPEKVRRSNRANRVFDAKGLSLFRVEKRFQTSAKTDNLIDAFADRRQGQGLTNRKTRIAWMMFRRGSISLDRVTVSTLTGQREPEIQGRVGEVRGQGPGFFIGRDGTPILAKAPRDGPQIVVEPALSGIDI
jgi:hypothetical protein